MEEKERAEVLWVGIMNREREKERERDTYRGSEAGGESMRGTDTVEDRRLLLFFASSTAVLLLEYNALFHLQPCTHERRTGRGEDRGGEGTALPVTSVSQ